MQLVGSVDTALQLHGIYVGERSAGSCNKPNCDGARGVLGLFAWPQSLEFFPVKHALIVYAKPAKDVAVRDGNGGGEAIRATFVEEGVPQWAIRDIRRDLFLFPGAWPQGIGRNRIAPVTSGAGADYVPGGDGLWVDVYRIVWLWLGNGSIKHGLANPGSGGSGKAGSSPSFRPVRNDKI
jgi:hypothetical protein